MKKAFVVLAVALLLFAGFSLPAAAYINRGTVQISCDVTELALEAGQTVQVEYTVDPESSDQMPGCGMSDCPENCGAGCLSKDGNCTCDSTVYQTYYTEVQVKKADESVVRVSCENGVATFEAVGPGSCTVNLAARLREFTGTSVDIEVTVTGTEKPAGWLVGGCLLLAAAAAAIVVARKKRGGRAA